MVVGFRSAVSRRKDPVARSSERREVSVVRSACARLEAIAAVSLRGERCEVLEVAGHGRTIDGETSTAHVAAVAVDDGRGGLMAGGVHAEVAGVVACGQERDRIRAKPGAWRARAA